MEHPGSYFRVEQDLDFLKQEGIEIIISLTLAPLRQSDVERYDFELFHIPIADGNAPTIPQIKKFVNCINYGLNGEKKILVHCGAGYGRTGTMFACYSVNMGYPPDQAIGYVRRKKPGSIENKLQEGRIVEYEIYLKERRKE